MKRGGAGGGAVSETTRSSVSVTWNIVPPDLPLPGDMRHQKSIIHDGLLSAPHVAKNQSLLGHLRPVTWISIVIQVTDLNLSTSSSAPLRSQPGAAKRSEWQWLAWSGPPCHPQHPQCSFPFHLECEIAAAAALTSALRGQLLKSDVCLPWLRDFNRWTDREGKKWKKQGGVLKKKNISLRSHPLLELEP